ncbi:MAG: hypothetical protein JJE17_06170 [Peptostreptococcaceae bacterium]|nr:hypothetical protein [Peptostreptococcaceae bacterium]
MENEELEEGIINETIHRYIDNKGLISEEIIRFIKKDGKIEMIDINKKVSGSIIINNYGVSSEEELKEKLNDKLLDYIIMMEAKKDNIIKRKDK